MKRPLFTLCLVLGVKAAFLIAVMISGAIGLGPDEAQYWTWSQQLDWGYYSKPPGIAWEIWTGNQILGNGELGVRLGALVIGFLLPLAVYDLARSSRLKTETAFWAGTVMALCPIGIFASFLATTDAGMVLFWTLSCSQLTRALSSEKSPNYLILGLLIAVGALFKWPIYLIWVFVLASFALYPFLYHKTLFAGIALSLLGLFPSVVWNAEHNWATFRHVSATIVGKQETTGNFLEFIGAQAALLSPIFFILLLCAFGVLIKQRTRLTAPLFFCGIASLLILSGYAVASLLQKIQGNWCVFAYPTGIVLLAWFACEHVSWGKLWLKIGTILSVALCLFLGAIPIIQSRDLFYIPYKMNPLKHNLGWERLAKQLIALGYNPFSDFLFSDKYQMTSILSYYGPGMKRAYFFNLHSVRNNQFSYWPDMPEEQLGRTGFFVVAENAPHLDLLLSEKVEQYQKLLSPYFQRVEYLGHYPLFLSNQKVVKDAIFFKCVNYNGLEPVESKLF